MKRSIEYEATYAVFFVHLFTSGLFNDAVSISNYIASNGKMITEKCIRKSTVCKLPT